MRQATDLFVLTEAQEVTIRLERPGDKRGVCQCVRTGFVVTIFFNKHLSHLKMITITGVEMIAGQLEWASLY